MGTEGQVNSMDDLIRRREVIAALGERPLVWVGSDYELGARNQYDCDRLAVETAPTVDAVPVVRCKDCKHHHYDRSNIPYCSEGDYAYGWKDDDFCSYGERKDGDGNG